MDAHVRERLRVRDEPSLRELDTMKATLSVLLLTLGLASPLFGVDWVNVDEDHYIAGRKCSSGYLRGKVVLVCRDAALSQRMEEVWTSFKTKPFVLVGSFAMKDKNLSFPVYSGAALAENSPERPFFVVDEIGRVRYMGADERRATEIVVTLLTDMEAPKSEAQARQFLDYELENLPGQAYNRYQDFKKRFPAAAKAYAEKYDELVKIPDVKKLAELVRFAKAAKDARAFNPKKARLQKSRLVSKIKDAISKYAPLKESENPLVMQEAKNALADLAWAKAALE